MSAGEMAEMERRAAAAEEAYTLGTTEAQAETEKPTEGAAEVLPKAATVELMAVEEPPHLEAEPLLEV